VNLFLRTSILLISLTTCIALSSPQQSMKPVWEQSVSRLRSASLAASGNCVAVTADDRLSVLGRDGRELWQWNFRPSNRLMVANGVAVSPDCNWAGFVGDSGYRYVWIVSRKGLRKALPFKTTPQAVAISNGGDKLVVGTAGNEIALYSNTGAPIWNLSAAGIITQMEFAMDDRAVMVTGMWDAALISIDGKLRWNQFVWVGGMSPAQDLKSFVTWSSPPHGPQVTVFRLLGENGDVLWTREGVGTGAVSPSGDRIALRLNDKQDVGPTFSDVDRPNSLVLLSRAGAIVQKLPGDGVPFAFSAEGKKLLVAGDTSLTCLDGQGGTLWTIPLPGYPRGIATTRNFETVLVRNEDQIRLFTPPR
jgi:DNA-binding beta-propeller fold protein YncE